MHEWALLIFTLCVQTAVGGILMLWIFHRNVNVLGEEHTFQLLKTPLYIVVGLAIVGLGASFAHLGTPTNAFYTITNIGSSWMSREILVTGLFIALAIVTLWLALKQKRINSSLLLLTSIVGLLNIYVMAMLYTTTLVSGWNSINTFTSFYGTALVLGPVLVASLVVTKKHALQAQNEAAASTEAIVKGASNTVKNVQIKKAQDLGKVAFSIATIGIAIQLLGLAIFATKIPEVNLITGTNGFDLLGMYQGTVALRWIIELVGIGFLGYLSMSSNKKLSPSFAYVALIGLVVAEGIGRYVFYVLGS